MGCGDCIEGRDMKKVIFLIVIFIIFKNWNLITGHLGTGPDYAAEHGGVAILYSTSWCGYCKKVRQLLRDNNIAYVEYDIERSAKGMRQHKALVGNGGIPVVLINKQVIRGYNPSRLLRLAGKN